MSLHFLPRWCHCVLIRFHFTSHLEHLCIAFSQLKEKGITINPEKCKFFKKKVNFLGRIIKKDGYQIDNKNINAVTPISETRQSKGV